MRFSQRYGYTPVKEVFQIDSMDSDLRNSLWNALEITYWRPLYIRGYPLSYGGNSSLRGLCLAIWTDYFKISLYNFPDSWERTKSQISDFFFECDWHQVYDFIEFMAQADSSMGVGPFEEMVNEFLEREVSGYRLLQGHMVRITDTWEVSEIQAAISGVSEPVSEQLDRGLQLLSDRKAPDYRNSVKESISAVEGQVLRSLGKDKGTLGDLLKQLESDTPLHPALKDGFSKLYGYTSDEGGIRHALLEESREVTFGEAKFMLVACSAFINYVRGITGR